MNTRLFSFASLALALPLGALVLSSAGGAPAPASASAQAAYTIDGVHSSIVFGVRHMDLATFYGRFDASKGALVLDEDPSKCSVELEIDATSVNTGSEKRDKHLMSADFFNTREFPSITFKSKEVAKKRENVFEVAGELTLHGITKPLTVQVEKTGQAETQSGEKAGFETTFTIKRSDFGMDYMLGKGLGDEVELIVSLEAGK